MTSVFKRFFERRSPEQVSALGLVFVVLVGIADYLTGYELSFSIFYLAPIVLVTWYAWKWAAFVICCVSAIVWFAVDYLSGHSYSHSLIPVLNAVVRFGFFLTTMLLVSEVKTLVKQQKTLATTDGLTELLNARAFKDSAQTILHLAERHNHPVALGYVDLDNFKRVNDTSGHSEGDLVLQAVANILARSVRAVDVVGRLGGDEFAILLPETDYAGAEELFGRIHERLTQKVTESGWPIGFSIGVAVFPVAHSDIDELLKIADRLMYIVKNSGKNNIICEEHDIVDPGDEHAAL